MAEVFSYKDILVTLEDDRLKEVLRLTDNVVHAVPAKGVHDFHERRSEMWRHVETLVRYVETVIQPLPAPRPEDELPSPTDTTS